MQPQVKYSSASCIGDGTKGILVVVSTTDIKSFFPLDKNKLLVLFIDGIAFTCESVNQNKEHTFLYMANKTIYN